MLEQFINNYLRKNVAFPKGFDRSTLAYWYDLLFSENNIISHQYLDIDKTKVALSYIPKSSILNRKPNYFKDSKIFIPEHQSIFAQIDKILSQDSVNNKNLIALILLKTSLLEELFTFEVENFEASKIINVFLDQAHKNIHFEKELLLKIKLFKNFKPREDIYNCSTFRKIDIYGDYLPITNEELDKTILEINLKIEDAKAKNPTFEYVKSQKSSSKKNYYSGLDLAVSEEKISFIYAKLIEFKYLKKNTTQEQFNYAFNGKNLPDSYVKIEWNSLVNLSIFIGEHIEEQNKWQKSKRLFENSSNLKALFQNAQRTKIFGEKIAFFNSIIKE